MRWIYPLLAGTVLLAGAMPFTPPAYASSTTTLSGSSCDYTGLATALSNSGTVVLDCASTITFTSPITIGSGVSVTLEVDPSQPAVLSGGNTTGLFVVASGGSLSLYGLTAGFGSGLTLEDALTANSGGAVQNQGTLTVTGVTFSGNTVTASYAVEGGAIYNHGQLVVADSTFTSNSSNGGGGAIWNSTSGSAQVSGSTFVTNATTNGDGGAIRSDGPIVIANSTFYDNSAAIVAGALYLMSATVDNSTLVDNSASQADNIFGSADINNSILEVSSTATGGNCSNGILSGTNNVEFGTGADTCKKEGGTGWITADPQLSPLGANGGPTETMQPASGSPAIGAGDTSVCTGSVVAGVDQRGVPRNAATCAIGAYEATFSAPTTSAVSPNTVEEGSGATVTVSGSGFGSEPGTLTFTQGSNVIQTSGIFGTWSDTEAQAALPGGLTPGTVQVAVTDPLTGQTSTNAQTFQVVAPAGSGSMTVSPGTVTARTYGNALTFQYVAATGNMAQGEVELIVPSGWSAPSTSQSAPGYTTASVGAVSVLGQTIIVQGVTLTAGNTLTITYGDMASGGPGAVPQSTQGSATFDALEASAGGATPAALAASPVVTVKPPVPLTPFVSSISPSSGPATGGTVVEITGKNFVNGVEVHFGQTLATEVSVVSASEITVTAPAGSGTVDVTVTSQIGTSAVRPADQFTYTTPLCANGSANPPAFSDVPAGYWAYSAIETAACQGIISGYPNGTFQPDTPLTRAEFVKMLVLTLGLNPAAASTPFTDVPTGSWYAPYVATALRAGIVQGTSATTFSPQMIVTREQMAAMLARALKLTHTVTLQFSDTGRIGAWALTGVEEVVAAGYMSGDANGTFQPLAPTTRAQAAEVLAAVLKASH